MSLLPDQRVLMEIAIIGLGSWGLSFLERIVTGSRSQWGPVRVHVVEPGTPGSGVYAVDQPDYLILNTPCGQVSLYPWQDEGPSPKYAIGLYEWVTAAGYRWVGDTCRIDPSGREINPRRLRSAPADGRVPAVVLRDARRVGTCKGGDRPPPHRGDEHREPGGRGERVCAGERGEPRRRPRHLDLGHTDNVEPDAAWR